MTDENRQQQPPDMPPPFGMQPQTPCPPPPQLNADEARELKSAQTLAMVSKVSGPVSLFVGGILLGTVGLVCGIVGLRKCGKLMAGTGPAATQAAVVRKSCVLGISVCGVSVALNAVAFYLMYPAMLEAFESGDMSAMFSAPDTASDSSTWG